MPIDPDIELLHDPIDDRYILPEDHHHHQPHYEERVPNVQQRLDRMTLDDEFPEIRPRAERLRSADVVPASKDYLYYRLTKRGDDWSSCARKPIPAPIEEIEKKARRSKGGDGPVLEQLTRMPPLRRDMVDEVVRKANDQETGDAHWEVVYIKSKKVQTRRGRMEVPEMDVILARASARSRAKSFAGEKVRRTESVKEKKYVNDSYSRSRKDSVLDKLEDPVANLPVFESDGRPRDDVGPMHFNNSNLPPHIAREMPLGSKLEKPKDKGDKKKKRDKSRSKSRERGSLAHHDEGVFIVPEVDEFTGEGADPITVDGMFDDQAAADHGRRGRRGQSPHEHPVVVEEDPRRSHSRHRPDGRSKSRPRRESVHFPNTHTRQYFDAAGDLSSENSDTSRYGFGAGGGEYESSATSISTPGAIPRRGSLARRNDRPDVVYKKHQPGPPSRRLSYQEKPYHDDQQQVVVPGRTARRNSNLIYYERPQEVRYERHPRLLRRETAPILEHHQIAAVAHEPPIRAREHQDLVPLRRSYTAREPIVHQAVIPDDEPELFYRDEVDRASFRAESYQRDRVLDDHFNRRDAELSARERELDAREDELRQIRRQREREREIEEREEELSRRERERERERESVYYDDARSVGRRDSVVSGRTGGERRGMKRLFYDARTGAHYYYNE